MNSTTTALPWFVCASLPQALTTTTTIVEIAAVVVVRFLVVCARLFGAAAAAAAAAAYSYVIQIKNRFDNDPRDSYNEFLNLLHDHQNSQKITMIVDKVCELFTDHQASPWDQSKCE